MIILSHRGFWEKAAEKNIEVAFKRSFTFGFGTETDIRDYQGDLVVSHDIADESCIRLERLFEIYNGFGKSLPLALNIKADGLQNKLKELLRQYNITNYFVFDMSIPTTLAYLDCEFNVFTRQSEYEKVPPFYEKSKGIWMDEFYEHWISKDIIAKYHRDNKTVCIVSPELHGRPFELEWEDYKKIDRGSGDKQLMICTDCPEKAREFFHGKD